MCAYFSQLQGLLSYQQFCNSSLNKNCKTYLKPMLLPGDINWQLIYPNGTAPFKKCKQLYEYKHYTYLETSGGQSSNLYLKMVHVFNTSVNQTSVAA